MAPRDRTCYRATLQNPIRRWLAPPGRELDWLLLADGQRVADLGAGVGYFDEEILRRIGAAGHLTAYDIDAANLAVARQRIGPDARYDARVGSAAHLTSIPDRWADRALLSLVICCLVDKEGALDEAWRILRPGGLALVTYPRRRRPRGRAPSLRVTPERWSGLAGRHGWTVRDVPSGWVVQRHLLEKPANGAGDG
jgi:SAM-dependent methyltransferase